MNISTTSHFVYLILLSLCGVAHASDVTKSQYDLACTGANTSETILTPGNVNTATFGKLFTKSVDGQVYAQPLYLQNFPIGGGVHNVVIICTENNSIYAFDADNGTVPAYWHRTLPTPQPSNCGALKPVVGITATPVIDRTAGALYVEASTYEAYVESPTDVDSIYYQKLFAIDLTSGADLIAPVTIQDTVSGSGSGSSDGKIAFDGLLQFCRPGLLLVNHKIYLGCGSHCDRGNYHGWLFAYKESDLTLSAAVCITPNGIQGGLWQYGGGISSDGKNIFCVTGNGSYNDSENNYGMSSLKFDCNLTLLSSFTPYNYAEMNDSDWDMSSTLLLIPGTSLCTMQGKTGSIYLMNQDNLGGCHSWGDSIVQRIDKAYSFDGSGSNPVAVFWNNLFYLWAGDDVLKNFSFNGATLGTSPQSSNTILQSNDAGSITLSAKGDSSGIVWGTDVGTGHFYAFDATNVATTLWNDGQAAGKRDLLGSPVQKYARPIVTNGKVYVPTTNSLVVYGLLDPSTETIGRPIDNAGMALVNDCRVARHFISLAFNRPGNYEIIVTDMCGRTMAKAAGASRGGNERIALPGPGLTPGIYMAFISFAQRRISIRAIIAQ